MRAKSGALAVLFCVFLMGACTTDPADASITIDNDSLVDLIELNVTAIDTLDWGPDLLRGTDLFPGEQITVFVSCDFYDMRLTSDTGEECFVDDIDLCANDLLFLVGDCRFI